MSGLVVFAVAFVAVTFAVIELALALIKHRERRR